MNHYFKTFFRCISRSINNKIDSFRYRRHINYLNYTLDLMLFENEFETLLRVGVTLGITLSEAASVLLARPGAAVIMTREVSSLLRE